MIIPSLAIPTVIPGEGTMPVSEGAESAPAGVFELLLPADGKNDSGAAGREDAPIDEADEDEVACEGADQTNLAALLWVRPTIVAAPAPARSPEFDFEGEAKEAPERPTAAVASSAASVKSERPQEISGYGVPSTPAMPSMPRKSAAPAKGSSPNEFATPAVPTVPATPAAPVSSSMPPATVPSVRLPFRDQQAASGAPAMPASPSVTEAMPMSDRAPAARATSQPTVTLPEAAPLQPNAIPAPAAALPADALPRPVSSTQPAAKPTSAQPPTSAPFANEAVTTAAASSAGPAKNSQPATPVAPPQLPVADASPAPTVPLAPAAPETSVALANRPDFSRLTSQPQSTETLPASAQFVPEVPNLAAESEVDFAPNPHPTEAADFAARKNPSASTSPALPVDFSRPAAFTPMSANALRTGVSPANADVSLVSEPKVEGKKVRGTGSAKAVSEMIEAPVTQQNLRPGAPGTVAPVAASQDQSSGQSRWNAPDEETGRAQVLPRGLTDGFPHAAAAMPAPSTSSAEIRAENFSTPASKPLTPAGVIDEIGRGLERIEQPNGTRVDLRLALEGGGHVEIELQLRDGAVHASIVTESSELREALQQSWSQLAGRSESLGAPLAEPVFKSPSSTNANAGQQGFGERRQEPHNEPPAPHALRPQPQHKQASHFRQTAQPARSGLNAWA